MTYTIAIPDWLPPTVNRLTRGKLRDRIRIGKSSREMIVGYALKCGVGRATGRRRVAMRFEHGPGVRRPDVDAYFKATLDGLKHAGAIRDDSPKWAELGTPRLEKSHRTMTTIVVEDIG